MSTLVMAACWPLEMPPTPKAVLISLADQANDQGGCWPSLETLCARTCLGERAVRNALRWLEKAGLLMCEKRRRKDGLMTSNFYTVTPQGFGAPAVAGAALADAPVGSPDTPASPAPVNGEAASNHRHVVPPAYPAAGTKCPLTVRKRNTNTPPNPPSQGSGGETAEPKRGRSGKPALEIKAWLAQCKAEGRQPIPETDPVFAYCDTVGISRELLALHWAEFKRRRGEAKKRQADWPQTFRNSVQDNWYRLWFIPAGGVAELTSQGRQAKAVFEAAQREREAEGAAA
jgi:hypothetical protein